MMILILICTSSFAFAEAPLDKLSLPAGFSIDVYVEGLDGARSMALGADGTLYIGTRTKDRLYAVPDKNGDNRGDRIIVLDSGLNSPNGVALLNGDLYVAEINRILRYDSIGSRLDNPPKPVVVYDDLPRDRHHGWKFIAFGPDGKLYVPIGAPCNVCERSDERYAGISRMNPDGSGFEMFAYGIRNTVGFSWHPETGELWFTDNGRDNLGDKRPPDELNRAPVQDLHFGFPYLHGSSIADPQYGTKA
ncbi:MAG: sorbosone dehydrogenase family protein, partial [Spirochaetales bacterium]|nr:sorbosone dehydrogenase family protein [Spirochaetales bacterium]